ncbi:MAG: hypothetical protein ACFHXK_11880 [bacterium]
MNRSRYYSGQFAVTPDLLHVTVPQAEIVTEMTRRGETETLNDICLAVAIVADAIVAAQALVVNS